jgi:hypothetical protein
MYKHAIQIVHLFKKSKDIHQKYKYKLAVSFLSITSLLEIFHSDESLAIYTQYTDMRMNLY